MRAAMHRAGAAALTALLQFPAPAADLRNMPCACGHQAHYRELRSKPVLTAVGQAEASRPYYLCPDCHNGQFPADVELDIVHTEFSPAVRRMLALVGQEAPFDHGRQQIKLLADLEVTTKNVERTAEAIGQDIAVGEQAEIQRAKQLDLPIVLGKPIPILCVEIDATGIPVVKKETVGRQGKDGHPARHRDCPGMFVRKLWRCSSACVRPRRTQNQITKRTQSDPLFSTRAENESRIPPTEAARLPCRRMYPSATGCNTIPNSEDVAPATPSCPLCQDQ